MTLAQAKQQVAESYQCRDWFDLIHLHKGPESREKLMDRVAQICFEEGCRQTINEVSELLLRDNQHLAENTRKTIEIFGNAIKAFPKPKFQR